MKIKNKLALLPLLLIQPATVHAALSEYISAAEGDPTYEMLGNLFGPVPGILEGTESPLSEMFMIFNVAVFTVAIVMVLYGVVSGIMHTAHEGEFLGKRHSTIWYPIRIVYGIFGLVPIFSGWSFPQVMMIGCMVLGIGISNLTWDVGWKFMLGHVENLVLVNPEAAGRDDAVEAVMRAQMCAQGHNEQQLSEQQVSGKPAVLFSVAGDFSQIPSESIVSLTWGSNSLGYNMDDCGGIRIRNTKMMMAEVALPYGSTASKPEFNADDVTRAHGDAMRQMSQSLLPLSTALYRDGIVPDAGALKRIRVEYMQTVGNALSVAAQQSQAGFGQYMDDVGKSWLYAGAIFPKIVDVNREIMSAAKLDLEILSAKYNSVPAGVISPASGGKEGLAKFEGMKSKVESSLNADKTDLTSFISETMGAGLVQSVMKTMTWGENDLMLGVINMGYTVLDAAWGSYVAGLVLSGGVEVLAGTKAVGTGPGTPTATIGMMLLSFATMIAPLIMVGCIFAFYVPFIPTVLWYGGVLSYGIVVLEAIAGAPLWMLAHLETEGEGLGHRTAHGYLFLLNVLFRPVLMTMGLVSGWLLMNIMGGFMQFLLSILFGTSSYGFNGIASIFMFIMTLCIFASLAMMTVSKSFSLIHHFPNEVLAWVGGHVGRIGGGEDDSAKHFIAGGMGAYASSAKAGMQRRTAEVSEGLKKKDDPGGGGRQSE